MVRFACNFCGTDMTEELMAFVEAQNAKVGLRDVQQIRRISNYLQDGHRYTRKQPFTREQYERVRDLGYYLIAYMTYHPLVCKECMNQDRSEPKRPFDLVKGAGKK